MDAQTLTMLIRRVPSLLAAVRSVGASPGWDDLYTVVDFVSDAFTQVYPSLPCAAGCSHCCEEMVFRVTAPEWDALRRYLEANWSGEAIAELQRSVLERYAAHRAQLDELTEYWSHHGLGTGEAPLEGLPMRCAMLGADGRCTAYDARPVVCRSYGNFGVTLAGKPTMLICQALGPQFIRLLAEGGTESITVPPVEPFFSRLKELAPEGIMGPLPWWILRWAEAAE